MAIKIFFNLSKQVCYCQLSVNNGIIPVLALILNHAQYAIKGIL